MCNALLQVHNLFNQKFIKEKGKKETKVIFSYARSDIVRLKSLLVC